MLLLDAHAHLTFKSFRKDLNDVIKRAKEAGVIGVVNSAIDHKDFEKALELSRKFPNFIFIAIGAAPQTLNEEKLTKILDIIDKYHKQAVAIGEIGLDYYWVKKESEREFTRKAFRKLVQIAISYDKPIVIHNRDATADIVKILESERAKDVMFHAFMASLKEANEILNHGWYVSIPTMIYRLTGLQQVVKKISLEKIFLETDSPFLSPIPRTRNEPANLRFSAKIISEVKGVPKEEVGLITTENAINFFNLKISTS